MTDFETDDIDGCTEHQHSPDMPYSFEKEERIGYQTRRSFSNLDTLVPIDGGF